jgi:ribonuclease HII
MAFTRIKPTLVEEKARRAEGYNLIAGVDEAGRGALMGPVYAAAVIMPEKIRAKWKGKVRDSKLLTPEARESLYGCITETAIAFGVGSIPNDVIDTVGIGRATCMAMIEAIKQLTPQPEFLLIDYFQLHEVKIPQKGVPEGDTRCFSIACASIIAKVSRDRVIVGLEDKYPGYGFAEHKGYSTKKHLACLKRLGPCPLHRRSFQPVSDIIEKVSQTI